jgi:hypothetical protein
MLACLLCSSPESGRRAYMSGERSFVANSGRLFWQSDVASNVTKAFGVDHEQAEEVKVVCGRSTKYPHKDKDVPESNCEQGMSQGQTRLGRQGCVPRTPALLGKAPVAREVALDE